MFTEGRLNCFTVMDGIAAPRPFPLSLWEHNLYFYSLIERSTIKNAAGSQQIGIARVVAVGFVHEFPDLHDLI